MIINCINLMVAYPIMYLVEKDVDSITLRSAFYSVGTNLDDENATSAAKEIVFIIANGEDGWEITSAEQAK